MAVFLLDNRVLSYNPLDCSCDHHWLQQWQLGGRGDLDSQPPTCASNGTDIPLDALYIENCSRCTVHYTSGSQTGSVTPGASLH